MDSRDRALRHRRARPRAVRVIASSLLVLTGVAGCGATPSDPEPEVGPESAPENGPETGAEAGPETGAAPSGLHRMTGHAVATDDTGLPDSPMTDATFVLLPAAVEELVWAAAGTDATEHQLPYLRASLDPVVLADGVLVEASTRGEFIVDIAVGEHMLCRVGDPVEGDTRWTRGCALVTVPGSGSWRITAGEGGLHATDASD